MVALVGRRGRVNAADHAAVAAELALKEQTGLTQEQIAQKVGVHPNTVGNIKRKLKELGSIYSYGDEVEKRFPALDRLQTLIDIAQDTKEKGIVRLKALTRLDQLAGYLSHIEQADAYSRITRNEERGKDPTEIPVFILPANTKVGILSPELRSTIEERARQLAAIDITPED